MANNVLAPPFSREPGLTHDSFQSVWIYSQFPAHHFMFVIVAYLVLLDRYPKHHTLGHLDHWAIAHTNNLWSAYYEIQRCRSFNLYALTRLVQVTLNLLSIRVI